MRMRSVGIHHFPDSGYRLHDSVIRYATPFRYDRRDCISKNGEEQPYTCSSLRPREERFQMRLHMGECLLHNVLLPVCYQDEVRKEPDVCEQYDVAEPVDSPLDCLVLQFIGEPAIRILYVHEVPESLQGGFHRCQCDPSRGRNFLFMRSDSVSSLSESCE